MDMKIQNIIRQLKTNRLAQNAQNLEIDSVIIYDKK